MAPKNHISDILRKETVRILLERFQSDMLGKMDDFPDEDVVCEDIEEQLDNAYVNRKGVPLAMDIFKPKVDEYTELPVIVVIHGGGLVMGDRKISRKFSRMLAQKGYLVFSIEYRLVPRANVCEQLDDVCAGMDLIGRKLVDYNVDFTRMFLVSESAGAYLATYVAAMKHSEKLQNAIGYQPTRMTFKALGLLSGMFYTNRPDPIGLLLAEQFYGEKGDDGTFLQYTDPEHPEIVSNLPPAFFITSRGDFLNRYSIDYHKALKKAGKEAYLLYYGSQELTHSFPTMAPDRAESEEAIDKMLAWFEEQAANHERMIKMKKDKTDNTAQLMARIESGEITDQKMWSYIKELNSASEERLNATAMIDNGREYTYRQMFRMWDRYAEVFSALGINEENQSRAAVIGIASPELMSTFYALNMTGASISLYPSSLVFIQERFEQMFVTEHITDLIISSAIANPALLNQLFANKEKLGLRHIIVLRDNEAGLAKGSMEKMAIHMAYQQIKNMPGVVFMHDLLTKYEATPITYGTAASKETALIVHTSGTTKGINKPIPHTDKGVNSAVNSFLTNPLFTGFAGKRTIMSGDMSGAYMIINQVHLPLAMGCPIVLVPSFGTQFQDVRLLDQHKVALLFVSPSWFDLVMGKPYHNLDLSSLEYVVLGGLSVSPEQKKRYNAFLAEHGANIQCSNGYGLSEACGACIVAPPDREDAAIGYPLPHVKVKIYAEEEQKFYDLADGPRTGVLYLNSPSVSCGKIDDTVFFELEEIDGEEYLCTYDLVTVNEDGSLTCCGRANRFFVNNEGIRFDAGIVETSIGAQPDIESCALVPAYDKILHDTMPVLYVKTVPKGPMAEKAVHQALYNVFIRDGKYAESNLPSQCVIAEKLPFNLSGKVSIYEIQQNGVTGGRYYRIDPIRIDGKLVDIKLMPIAEEAPFGRYAIPEELLQDAEAVLGGMSKIMGDPGMASGMPQGFGYQQMPQHQGMPQGFGYQQMPKHQGMPQGFGYQQMPKHQGMPQGFGYQQMPKHQGMPQGFGYQQMPQHQGMPQGFGYQQMPQHQGMPQGFGYQQMPQHQGMPQGFGYQQMSQHQGMPQGFGYPQMPQDQGMPQGFSYQQMPQGQRMPQGFGYAQMPQGQAMPPMMGMLMNLLGFFFGAPQNDYNNED